MLTITTKYHGPTNTRGARITATDANGEKVTIPFRYKLNTDEAHTAAARALCEKLGWTGEALRTSGETGYVFVPIIGSEKVTF